jgi:ATP-dependent DNA helicase RecQ/Werner syndrome ATP-dependent helicase
MMTDVGNDPFEFYVMPTSSSSSSDVMEQQQQPLPVAAANNNNNDNNNDKDNLEKTLQQYFGYPKFRPGQLEVIQAILQQRDTAVFWATGAGKSLCYQIPALYMNQVALVVSPLISLMQDQVHKLNGLMAAYDDNDHDRPLATFLGSSQFDPHVETRALQGDYPLVYVTPEKLMSNGFLDKLGHMHRSKKRLAVVAIDEAHCVSQYAVCVLYRLGVYALY